MSNKRAALFEHLGGEHVLHLVALLDQRNRIALSAKFNHQASNVSPNQLTSRRTGLNELSGR